VFLLINNYVLALRFISYPNMMKEYS
jgi:hypothetical protein